MPTQAELAQLAAARVEWGENLSAAEQAALRAVWGKDYDAQVKARMPSSVERIAIQKIRNGQTPTPQETAILQKKYGAQYAARTAQMTKVPKPVTPVTPLPGPVKPPPATPPPGGKIPPPVTPPPPVKPPPPPGTPTPLPPLAPQTPLPPPTPNPVPVNPNIPGLDSGEYPKWMTDIMADPKKLADPKNVAAINTYLAAIGDKRSESQWRTENAWRQGQDTFNMKLADRQQKMAEWQAQESVRQEKDRLALDSKVGLGNLENTAIRNANEFEIGRGANLNDATRIKYDYEIGTGRNQNDATANANTLKLGELNAQVNREGQQNDLTEARYATFGRAKAPNTRTLRSWG